MSTFLIVSLDKTFIFNCWLILLIWLGTIFFLIPKDEIWSCRTKKVQKSGLAALKGSWELTDFITVVRTVGDGVEWRSHPAICGSLWKMSPSLAGQGRDFHPLVLSCVERMAQMSILLPQATPERCLCVPMIFKVTVLTLIGNAYMPEARKRRYSSLISSHWCWQNHSCH